MLGSDSERQGFEPVCSRLPGRARCEAGTNLFDSPDESAVADSSAQAVSLHLGRGRSPGLDSGGSRGQPMRALGRRSARWRTAARASALPSREVAWAVGGIPGDSGGGGGITAVGRSSRAEIVSTMRDNPKQAGCMSSRGVGTAEEGGDWAGCGEASSGRFGKAVARLYIYLCMYVPIF